VVAIDLNWSASLINEANIFNWMGYTKEWWNDTTNDFYFNQLGRKSVVDGNFWTFGNDFTTCDLSVFNTVMDGGKECYEVVFYAFFNNNDHAVISNPSAIIQEPFIVVGLYNFDRDYMSLNGAAVPFINLNSFAPSILEQVDLNPLLQSAGVVSFNHPEYLQPGQVLAVLHKNY
jgi:hypothetical protein